MIKHIPRSQPGLPAGFTLLELLVVLVILGLLASLVGPQVLKQPGQLKNQVRYPADRGIQRRTGSLPPGGRPLPHQQ